MGYYPVFLDVTGKSCLVVGGGKVAFQKVAALRKAGANVTVVAPRMDPRLVGAGTLRCLRRAFRPTDLSPRPWLVVAATDDEKLNSVISARCRRRRVWVNVVDRPTQCDFIVPSVVRRGPVTFAVSTGGNSPALAKFLGIDLRTRFGPEVGKMALALKDVRGELTKVPMARRRTLLKRLITGTWIKRFREAPRRATKEFHVEAMRLARSTTPVLTACEQPPIR